MNTTLDIDSTKIIQELFGEHGLHPLNKVRQSTKTGATKVNHATLRNVYEVISTRQQALMAGLNLKTDSQECYICGIPIINSAPNISPGNKDGLTYEIDHTLPMITAIVLYGINVVNNGNSAVPPMSPDQLQNEYRLSHKFCNHAKRDIVCIMWNGKQFELSIYNMTYILKMIWNSNTTYGAKFKKKLHNKYKSIDVFIENRMSEGSTFLEPFVNICAFLNKNSKEVVSLGLYIMSGATMLKEGPMIKKACSLLLSPEEKQKKMHEFYEKEYNEYLESISNTGKVIELLIKIAKLHKLHYIHNTYIEQLLGEYTKDITEYVTLEYLNKFKTPELRIHTLNVGISLEDIINVMIYDIFTHLITNIIVTKSGRPKRIDSSILLERIIAEIRIKLGSKLGEIQQMLNFKERNYNTARLLIMFKHNNAMALNDFNYNTYTNAKPLHMSYRYNPELGQKRTGHNHSNNQSTNQSTQKQSHKIIRTKSLGSKGGFHTRRFLRVR